MQTLGNIDIPTTGTRVRVTTDESIWCEVVYFQAPVTNTGLIYIGNSSVSSTAGGFGTLNIPAATGVLPEWRTPVTSQPRAMQLAGFYVDASVNGDDVLVSYR